MSIGGSRTYSTSRKEKQNMFKWDRNAYENVTVYVHRVHYISAISFLCVALLILLR